MTKLNGFIRPIEQFLFGYQEGVDGVAAEFSKKNPADVGTIDRFLLLPAALMSIAGCSSGYPQLDDDNDGYCKLGQKIENASVQCYLEKGEYGTDCNDNDKNIHPGMSELDSVGWAYDGIDNNCDGLVDEVIVDGKEVTLNDLPGKHDLIHIKNGGKLLFKSSNIEINAKKIIVEKDSSITVSSLTCGLGDGLYGEGAYDGGGGGGGSHIAKGGSGGNGGWKGVGGGSGNIYGSASDFTPETGSCGGRGGGPYGGSSGGKGGGAITINAEDAIIYGIIYAQGYTGGNAAYDDGGKGGGSGGSILLNVINLMLDTASSGLYVYGGNGGTGGSFSYSGGGGGGGGAGGKVEIKFSTAKILQSSAETYYTMNDKKQVADLLAKGIVILDPGAGGKAGCGSMACGEDGQPGEKGILQLFE